MSNVHQLAAALEAAPKILRDYVRFLEHDYSNPEDPKNPETMWNYKVHGKFRDFEIFVCGRHHKACLEDLRAKGYTYDMISWSSPPEQGTCTVCSDNKPPTQDADPENGERLSPNPGVQWEPRPGANPETRPDWVTGRME